MPRTKSQNFFLIVLLGSLTALSPFSIDMYLPSFPKIAEEFGVSTGFVALSLSSYFIGLSIGQLFYGPLLDRFGRKKPLYLGLLLYIAASFACMASPTARFLIFFRLLQALGGCAASVATVAMVRDLFSVKEGARVFSLLMLILSASPMLAPTVGSFVAGHYGWKMVFAVLASIALLILIASALWLPDSHEPDFGVVLAPGPIFRNFALVLRQPQFLTYALSGAIAFAGLFTYVSGSPLLFLETLKVSPAVYSRIFAFIAVGLIGAAQVNILLLKKYRNDQIYLASLVGQAITGVLFLAVGWAGGLTLPVTVAFLFVYLACLGFTSPNGSALALGPFHKNTGSASAMLGFLQMGMGALASLAVGVFDNHGILPLLWIFVGTACGALLILKVGGGFIRGPLEEGGPGEVMH